MNQVKNNRVSTVRKYRDPIILFLVSIGCFAVSKYLLSQRTCYSHCFNLPRIGLSCTMEANCQVDHLKAGVSLYFVAIIIFIAALVLLAMIKFKKSKKVIRS